MNNNITLNQIIFYECSIYIAYKSTFKEILEFALLSKKSFKIFQNIISNECKRAKILLNLDSLLSYILDTNHEDINSLSLKLIKYDEIQHLYTQITTNKTNCQNYRCDKLVTKLPNNYQLKVFLPNLKSIYYLNTISAKFYGIEDVACFDYNELEKTKENNFRLFEEQGLIDEIVYDKVEMNWYENDPHDINEYPVSNYKEFSNFTGSSIARENRPTHYPFSFDFVRYQLPKKLYILNAAYKFDHLYSIDNLLNFKSINTIKFISNNTSPSFLNKALSLPNITSLLVRLKNENNLNGTDNDDQNDIINLSFSNSICNLKGLQLCVPFGYKSTTSSSSSTSSLKLFFQYLHGNKSLKAIGLDYFNVHDSNELLPLLEFKNITTLYCTLYDISQNQSDISIPSILPFLNHLNENSNIKHLKIYIPDLIDQQLISNLNFYQFFKTNQSLEKLTIQYGINLKEQILKIANKINRFLINSGNNNIELKCSLTLTQY